MPKASKQKAVQVAIIGSGFGGIGMAYYLKQAGIESFAVLEKADDLGGTWRDNRYPGAGCDVPSHLYSFSFEPHYPWSKRYAAQAQIHSYIRHCAKKYGLLSHIRYGCEVSAAKFDEATALWTLTLQNGETLQAQFVVSAVGQLSRPAIPAIEGRESFAGESFHSANWNHDYDLNGKRVAVIGTGASAVQFVPEIVKKTQRLDVYQRSPGWTIPKVEKEFSDREINLLQKWPTIHDLDRARVFGATESLGIAYRGNKLLEMAVTQLARNHLRRQIKDKALRRKLTPDYPVGCKRILLSNEWLPALAEPNVEVITEGVASIDATGITSSEGHHREVDAIIYSTGFQASDFLAPIKVEGLNGIDLNEAWRDGTAAYLGMAVPQFPNFFMLYGPNTNVGSGSVIFMLECQQRYVVQMLRNQDKQGWRYADVLQKEMLEFRDEIRQRSAQSTFEGDCQSWYKDANGHNSNNWVGSMHEYRKRTETLQQAHFDYSS